MLDILVVVDMQNDFIDGVLGTKEAVQIVPYVVDKIKNFNGKVYFTRDTHFDNYLETQEGKKIPILHCIKGTHGWQIHPEIDSLRKTEPIDKVTFGSTELIDILKKEDKTEGINSITFVGVCTDICVISNVMTVKTFFPDVPLYVDSKCCAGTTPSNHQKSLDIMSPYLFSKR